MEKLVLHVFFANIFGSELLTIAISNHPSSASWPSMSVSADEVAKHNTDKDCWVIVGDQVLDVTNFLSDLAHTTKWCFFERHSDTISCIEDFLYEDSAYGSWFMNASHGIFVHSCASQSRSRPFSIRLIALSNADINDLFVM